MVLHFVGFFRLPPDASCNNLGPAESYLRFAGPGASWNSNRDVSNGFQDGLSMFGFLSPFEARYWRQLSPECFSVVSGNAQHGSALVAAASAAAERGHRKVVSRLRALNNILELGTCRCCACASGCNFANLKKEKMEKELKDRPRDIDRSFAAGNIIICIGKSFGKSFNCSTVREEK